jgi:hypothetical protein
MPRSPAWAAIELPALTAAITNTLLAFEVFVIQLVFRVFGPWSLAFVDDSRIVDGAILPSVTVSGVARRLVGLLASSVLLVPHVQILSPAACWLSLFDVASPPPSWSGPTASPLIVIAPPGAPGG